MKEPSAALEIWKDVRLVAILSLVGHRFWGPSGAEMGAILALGVIALVNIVINSFRKDL